MMRIMNDTRRNEIHLWIVNVEPWNEKPDSCWICEGTVIFGWNVIHWYVIVTILGHRVMTMSDWEEPSNSSSVFIFLVFGTFAMHHIWKGVSTRFATTWLFHLGICEPSALTFSTGSRRPHWFVYLTSIDNSPLNCLVSNLFCSCRALNGLTPWLDSRAYCTLCVSNGSSLATNWSPDCASCCYATPNHILLCHSARLSRVWVRSHCSFYLFVKSDA